MQNQMQIKRIKKTDGPQSHCILKLVNISLQVSYGELRLPWEFVLVRAQPSMPAPKLFNHTFKTRMYGELWN